MLYLGAIAAAPSEATTGIHNKCPKWGGDLTFLHLPDFGFCFKQFITGEQHQHGNGHRHSVPDEQ